MLTISWLSTRDDIRFYKTTQHISAPFMFALCIYPTYHIPLWAYSSAVVTFITYKPIHMLYTKQPSFNQSTGSPQNSHSTNPHVPHKRAIIQPIHRLHTKSSLTNPHAPSKQSSLYTLYTSVRLPVALYILVKVFYYQQQFTQFTFFNNICNMKWSFFLISSTIMFVVLYAIFVVDNSKWFACFNFEFFKAMEASQQIGKWNILGFD